MLPQKAIAVLADKGIDPHHIVELSQNKELRGTLVEIDEHKKNEKVIIAIE
jgi:small nuclear ribonucleoprotein (snRNP)-like protein